MHFCLKDTKTLRKRINYILSGASIPSKPNEDLRVFWNDTTRHNLAFSNSGVSDFNTLTCS